MPVPGRRGHRRRGLRHGRLGDRRRPGARAPTATACCEPMTVVRDYYLPGLDRRGHAGDPELLLGRHRGDAHLRQPGARAQRPLRRGDQRRQARLASTRPRACRSSRCRPGCQPRAALLRLLVPVVVLLDRMGAVPPLGSDLEEARETHRRLDRRARPEVPEADEPGQAARPRAAWASVPLIWGAELTAAGRLPLEAASSTRTPSCRPASAGAARARPQRDRAASPARRRRAGRPHAAGDAARPAPPPPGGAALRPHPRDRRAARGPGALDHRRGPERRSRGCSTW